MFSITNNKQKRLILFLLLCIPVRILIVYTIKNIDKFYLPYLAIIGLLISVGFIFIYLFDYRKTGAEVFGDKIWWNDLRPVHGCLYLMFALLAFKKNKYAWIPLALDIVIGLTAFMIYHKYI
tara:strand:+ start:169 stop:534 length:366 start_codon:yes stop_codon:yes gene_type:complete